MKIRTMNKSRKIGMILLTLIFAPLAALATPSTTYWSVTTAGCQAYNVPHVSYDTYFAQVPAGSAYPIDLGLTMGILPYEKIQAEIGFDSLMPAQDPLYGNAKICTSESSLFDGSPGIGVGIYNVGFKKDVNDYGQIYYAVLQKTITSAGGYVALGAYQGPNETLFTNSDGQKVQTGILAAIASPDIHIGKKGLRKINFVADVQTGKNFVGAWGFGSNIYFADNVSLLTGPVFFFDKSVQPGGREQMWSMQLDIDIPLDAL